MEIEGKAAIVTGGGTGVGRATALALARRGCSVVLNYSRSASEAEATADEVRSLGVRCRALQADIADDSACQTLVEAALAECGRLDILVNNAATTSFVNHRDLDGLATEDWDKIFSVNVRGTFQCTRAARAALEASGSGEVVNVSSVAGIAAVGSSIAYRASKAAVNNMTVALARALAPKIRVNAVAPGFITGRWLQAGLGAAYELAKQNFERTSLLKRACDPEDVAGAILALITGPDLVTGQILTIDGGMLLAR